MFGLFLDLLFSVSDYVAAVTPMDVARSIVNAIGAVTPMDVA